VMIVQSWADVVGVWNVRRWSRETFAHWCAERTIIVIICTTRKNTEQNTSDKKTYPQIHTRLTPNATS